MKNMVWVLMVVIGGTASSWADYQKGNQSLEFHLGSVGFSDDVKVNNGDDKLRDCGGTGGFQYLYFVKGGPTLAIGPDILWSDLSEKDNSSIVASSRSHGAARTAVYQSLVKLVYPTGHWRPYVIGGMGASRSSIQGDISPLAGATIQTFDSVRYGFAGTWGVGLDIFPREHWFLGLELRQVVLSRLVHGPTAEGAALGIQPVRDPGAITSVLLRAGYKFGAN